MMGGTSVCSGIPRTRLPPMPSRRVYSAPSSRPSVVRGRLVGTLDRGDDGPQALGHLLLTWRTDAPDDPGLDRVELRVEVLHQRLARWCQVQLDQPTVVLAPALLDAAARLQGLDNSGQGRLGDGRRLCRAACLEAVPDP